MEQRNKNRNFYNALGFICSGWLPVFFFCFSFTAHAADHYVRSDAAGVNNGNNWTDAWQQLPTNLVRGDTYFIADGTYNGYAFDDAESGTSVITIKKATVSAHGTDEGWNNAYGDGQAEWSANLAFGTNYYTAWAFLDDYYVVDGATGGGPGNWTAGHGFIMSDQNTGRYFVLISDKFGYFGARQNISNITIKHLEVRGHFGLCGNSHAINATASDVTKTNITISHCYFHDLSPIIISSQVGVSDWTIEYSKLDRVYSGFGVEGCHGSMMRMDYAHDMTIRYNNLSNGSGSNWIGAYNGANHNIFVYGNYLYCDDSVGNCSASPGLISSEHQTGDPDISGYHIYNNSFYNLHPMDSSGRTAGIGYLIFIEGGTGSENYMKNNVFYGCNPGAYVLNATEHSHNAADENISSDNGFQLLASDPFVNSANKDFRLVAPSMAGVPLSTSYAEDMLGSTRGADGSWDRGAFEFVSGPPDTTPPASPAGLTVR